MLRALLFVFFFIGIVYVNAATLKGVVKDAKTQEPVIGASISVKGGSIGTQSGLDGSFVLKNVPPGQVELEITYLGYLTKVQKIDSEQQSVINIELTEAQKELNEVVIHGTEDKGSDAFARRGMLQADNMVNIVSAQAIQISPDITVANVVQRVSGVSIERNSNGDGQHAIIRGMDKRYNYTLINGVKIPSPDNKYRYVPLDIFPAELLDRLEVSKSLTPSMEGDAIGGSINMVMKDAPHSRTFSTSFATGYSELFMSRDFQSYDQSGIQKESPYERFGKNYRATMSDFPTGTSDYSYGAPLPNLIAGISYGDRFFKKKLGFIVAGSYQNTYRGSNSLFYNAENVDTNSFVTITQMNERMFSEQQKRYGIHTKLDFKLSPRHQLRWYNAYMNLTNIQTRDTKTTDFSAGYNPVTGDAKLAYSTRTRLTIQQIMSSTLQGSHSLGAKWKAHWSAVYSLATNQIPDNTTVNLRGERTNGVDKRTTADNSTRRWEHNDDRDLSGYANIQRFMLLGNAQLEWNFGGLYHHKTRSNFFNNYQLQIAPYAVNYMYGVDFNDYTEIPWVVQNPRGSVATSLYYQASEDIHAEYAQLKTTLKSFEMIGGIRFESTNQGYVLEYPAGEPNPKGNQVYTDVLPSVHLKYRLTAFQFLKGSYFKAINRPGYFEIVPYRVVNEDYSERGNPDLKRAIADNIDLRYEWYSRKNDQFLIGVFYKKIQDPIEYTLQPSATRGQDLYYSPGNFGTAINYGFEVDFIKYVRFFGVKGNYTFTESSITTAKSKRIRNSSGNLETIAVDQERPLYGQSMHIANVALLYKNSPKGWDVQLAWNYTGERINTVSKFVGCDLWQKAFVQMDASLEKQIKKRLILFAKANNLLNTPMEVFVKGTNAQNEDVPNQDNSTATTLIRRDYYQRSYMLGLRYKI